MDRAPSREESGVLSRLLLALVLPVVGLGVFLSVQQAKGVDRELRQTLLGEGLAIARAIDRTEAGKLAFTPGEGDAPVHARFHRMFQGYARWKGLHAIRTLARRGDDLWLGPGSLDPAEDTASPGQRYRLPPPGLFAVFSAGHSTVLGPYRDERGEFLSAFVPVADPHDQAVRFVLGVDLPASAQSAAQWREARFPFVYAGVVAGLLVLGGWGAARRRRRGGAAAPGYLAHLEVGLVFLIGATLTVASIHLIGLGEARAARALFRQGADVQLGGVAIALGEVRDQHLPFLADQFAEVSGLSRTTFEHRTASLIGSSRVRSLSLAPVVGAEDLPALAQTAREDGEPGYAVFDLDAAGKAVPSRPAPRYAPLRFAIPADDPGLPLGLNLLGHPRYRQAVLEVERTRLPVAIETEAGRGLLLLHPLLGGPDDSPTLAGLVLAHVDLGTLLQVALQNTGHSHADSVIAIHRLSLEGAAPKVAEHQASARGLAAPEEALLAESIPVFLPDHPLGVRMVAARSSIRDDQNANLLIAACVLCSVVLVFVVWLATRQRRQLERQVEERTHDLRESEEAYRRQFLDNGETMLLVDPETGKILDANHAAARYYGYPRDELLRLFFFTLAGGEETAVVEQLRGLVGAGPRRFEAQHRLASGESRKVEVSSSLIRWEGKAALHTLVIDITERKRAEAELRSTNQRLEWATSLANDLALQAAAASSAKSEFLANMSHEIRTPMNAIVGMTGLLLDTQVTPEQHRYLQILRTSGQALLLLINDILDLSKIEAGKLVLESQDFHLHEVLDDLTELLAIKAHGKGLNLACIIDPKVPLLLRGDAIRLRQVLVNLGDNAIKFCPSGDVILRVRVASLPGEAARLTFSVTDTGIGIPSDKLATLFQPFTQVDGSTTRKYGGSGLGLAISKKLVELMGGEITVTSEEGKGSVFEFTVAIARQTLAGDTRRTLEGMFAVMPVLVADPHAPTRQAIEAVLTSFGCVVALAEDAAAVHRLIEEGKSLSDSFPLILLDPNLPGLDLARLVAALPTSSPHLLVELKPLGRVASSTRPYFGAQTTKPVRASNLQEIVLQAAGIDKLTGPTLSALGAGDSGALSLAATPKRILVVEDNPTNQIVTTKVLERLGYAAEVSENGVAALARLAQQSFDLVLMDCQMPEMDGFEATRQIRAGKTRNTQVTVVALTAFSQPEDRRRCLEAGMNDYVSKPVQPDHLARVLKKWFGATARVSGNHPAIVGGNLRMFNREELMQRVMGDEGLVRQILTVFLADLPKTLDEIQEAMKQQDLKHVARSCHRLKGACLNISAGILAELAKGMELGAKAGDEVLVRGQLPGLLQEAQNLTNRLQHEIRVPSKVSTV